MTLLRPTVPVQIPMLAMLEPGRVTPVVASWNQRKGAGIDQAVATPGDASTFGDLLDRWRRKSGIPRPSSAARASIAAATVCQALVQNHTWASARLGIIAASTSSATWAAVSFEMRGLAEGWNAVDPLLLPSTLQSALATQVAMALGARAFAVSFVIGSLGVFHAMEAAILALMRGDADVVIVVASEEQTLVQRRAHEVLGWTPVPSEWAGALVLERGRSDGFGIEFLGYSSSPEPLEPAGWENACHARVASPHRGPSMQCAAALRTISYSLVGTDQRILASAGVAGLGSASVGLNRLMP